MKIVLIGKSGSGKDTIASLLQKIFNYEFVTLTTSRPMRDYESENNPYIFVSKLEFEKLINENKLIEYRSYETLMNNVKDVWYYGIDKKSIKSNNNYVIVNVPKGLEVLKKEHNDIISFFINVDDELRTKRAMLRNNFDLTEWNRRLLADEIDFKNAHNECDFVVDNIDLETTFDDIINLIYLKNIKGI